MHRHPITPKITPGRERKYLYAETETMIKPACKSRMRRASWLVDQVPDKNDPAKNIISEDKK
jgi:hypothetical protein